MKNALTTLGTVAGRVDTLSKNCFDRTIPVSDISFESLDSVLIAGEKHPLREMAQRSFCYRLGIPYQYLRKCPADVQSYNMNHWMPQEKNPDLYLRFDGYEVRAMFTPKYTPIDNFEVLERIYALGYNDDTEVQCSLDGEFMSLNILDGKQAFDISGDTFKPGVSFSNSEVGLASLSIAAFILRLVCTNGLVAKTDLSKSFKHVSGKVLDKFPEILEGVATELSLQKDRFKLGMESTVDDGAVTIEMFNRQFALSADEKDAVDWAVPYEFEVPAKEDIGKTTMFQVCNVYTRAAQYEDLSAGSSFRLQKTGGQILAMLT